MSLKILAAAQSALDTLKATAVRLGLVKQKSDKLDDGRQIEYDDELAVGQPVEVVDENGNQAALPDGAYTTEAGQKFTITDGLVSEIEGGKEAEETTEEKPAEKVTQSETPIDLPALKSKLSKFSAQHPVKFAEGDEAAEPATTGSVEDRIAVLETIVAALVEYCFGWQKQAEETEQKTEQALQVYETNFKKVTSEQNATISKFSSLTSKIAERAGGSPAGEAVGFNKQPKASNETKNTGTGNLAAFAAAITKK